jgi:hypothetical protein
VLLGQSSLAALTGVSPTIEAVAAPPPSSPHMSKWFCDTSSGAATGATRCGSFVGGGFGVGVDLQMVLDHLPRGPGYMRWLPCKHIRVSSEEGDEREFLFVVQVTRDTGSLSSIGPNLNGLHGDVLSCRGLHAGCWGRDALARARRSWTLVSRFSNGFSSRRKSL